MITYNTIYNLSEKALGSVLVIGNFDGLHLGHQSLIEKGRVIANNAGALLGVMTFEPHPRQFFKSVLDDFRITSLATKQKLLDKAGVDFLLAVEFNEEFSNISGEDFINIVLLENMQVSHIVIGENFAFGHKHSGKISMLKEAASSGKFGLTIVESVKSKDDLIYSSTKIRELLKQGNLLETEKLLGRKWCIESPVIDGDKRGRELGFPTANQNIGDYIRIPYGVYVVKILIEGESIWREGVANFGIRPMFESKLPIFETFIFDFSKDVYGKNMSVVPIKQLRPEMSFKNIELLVEQIKDDCIKARAVLKSLNS